MSPIAVKVLYFINVCVSELNAYALDGLFSVGCLRPAASREGRQGRQSLGAPE